MTVLGALIMLITKCHKQVIHASLCNKESLMNPTFRLIDIHTKVKKGLGEECLHEAHCGQVV